MKKSGFPIMVWILLILTSCSKEDPIDFNRYRIDKEYFFTISFEGRTLNSYGFEDLQTKVKGGPSLVGVLNKVWIFDFADITFQNINGVPAHLRGDVEFRIELSTSGTWFTGNYSTLHRGEIKDLKTGKVYEIDYDGVDFQVDEYNQSTGNGLFAEGSFKFNLKEPNSNRLIPATGMFRSHSGK